MKRTNVTLRQRTLPSGRTTLYLDITSGGKRRNESLKLFLVPEMSRADKQKNKETMMLAKAVLAKRIVDIKNNEFGFEDENTNEILFYDYYVMQAEKHKEKNFATFTGWMDSLKHIEMYDKNIHDRTFSEIDVSWVTGFRKFLENAKALRNTHSGCICRNTQKLYWTKLVACMNSAVRDSIIDRNPTVMVDGFKKTESTRMYLTVDEVRKLAATKCRSHVYKNAFLFSCMTGLRFSDVKKLTWGEVQRQGDFIRLVFKQKKTGGMEYLDITPQAAELLGERGKQGEQVFAGMSHSSCANDMIRRWVRRAGIDKHISFHCARHTFAVMMLDIGADIYTVSKLLGHKKIETTQIYAKILDKNKQSAVKKIPNLLN